nr:1-aminocyclopropane-1-carboxylate oxidase like [Quercus suber]
MLVSPKSLEFPSAHRRISPPIILVIDLRGRRADTVNDVQRATKEVGFFQVMNHGIAERVLEEMLEVARGFHELLREVKVEYHAKELMKKVKFGSNFDLYKLRFTN